MRRHTPFLLTGTAALIVVIASGGAWLWVARTLPGADRPGPIVAVIGGVFSLAFMWLLIHRLRRLLAHPEQRWVELGLLVVNFAVIILAFAWVHHEIGLMDYSKGPPVPSHRFQDALYFSVITITTVGYGDFIPLGVGRAIAAMQGLVGYFMLGILVSTGFQLIAPDEDAEERRQEATGGKDRDGRDDEAAGREGGHEGETREEGA